MAPKLSSSFHPLLLRILSCVSRLFVNAVTCKLERPARKNK